jgi:hypothetical protein
MGRVLLYTYFLASVGLIVLGVKDFVRVTRVVAVLGRDEAPTPKWLPVFIFCFGCLGVASSAPSIFSNNPHWFVDKIYFVVSRVIAALSG